MLLQKDSLSKKQWGKVVAQGQFCAVMTSLTGVTASTLAKRGVSSPLLTNWPAYLLMALFTLRRREKEERMTRRELIQWLLLGIVDVEANYLAVWAYSRTSLTSAMLLDNFSIPCVMILSVIFLKASFSRAHVVGTLLCLLGILVTVCSDALPITNGGRGDGWFTGGDAVLGDGGALLAAVLYAVSNVAQEAWVKHASPATLLGRLGVAGFFVTGIQAAVVRPDFTAISGTIVLSSYFGYSLALTGMYVGASHFLVDSDATALNLSLLVADVYSVLYSALVDNDPPPPLYYLAFFFTACGVLRYTFARPSTDLAIRRRGRTLSAGSALDRPGSDASSSCPGGILPEGHVLLKEDLIHEQPGDNGTSLSSSASSTSRYNPLHENGTTTPLLPPPS